MGARSGADRPAQANPLQSPWHYRPLVHEVLWPYFARRIRRVARLEREVSSHKRTFPMICARGLQLEQA